MKTLSTDIIQKEFQSNTTYLNTSATGLVPVSLSKVVSTFHEELATSGSDRADQFREQEMPETRKMVANFIGADLNETCFLPNFSFGINAIVHSLKPGKRVLLYGKDFPSLTEPFLVNNFEVSWFDDQGDYFIDLNKIEDIIQAQKIDILAISHVQWLSGIKVDLHAIGEICKKNGVIFIADVTQSMGAILLNFNKIGADVMLASNYKWMNAGFGSGIMAAKEDFLQANPPAVAGFGSYVLNDNKWQYAPSIKSYEPGHLNSTGILAIRHSLNLKMDIGIEEIERHNMYLANKLRDGLSSLGFKVVGANLHQDSHSAIVCFEAEDDVLKHLLANGVLCSKRLANIRMAVHFHNTASDIDKVLSILVVLPKARVGV